MFHKSDPTPLCINTDRPSKEEIRKAILQLKNEKAPGPDGIPPEAIKADAETSVDCLYWLFGKIWVEEEIPEDWRHGHQERQFERLQALGITLLSIPGKVFNRILLERMKTEVDRLLREEQAGFRKERSCTGHIATPRVIIEQSLDWNSLYITFVDFEKAFDSVNLTSLWKLLAHYGIPEKIIRLIRTTYEPSTCQVVHNSSLTEPFSILTGVRQGCLLSPFLFLLAVDWIMASTIEGCQRGIQWTLSKQLADIDFADDVALLSHHHDNMQDKATSLYESAAKLGLKINKKKTRTMTTNHVNKNSIQLRGEDIEDVEQFTYLGSVVSRDGGTDRDIKSRTGKATAAFKTLRPIWTSQVISIKTQLQIFNTNVKSALYVCETWRITKALTHKVQTFIDRSKLEGHPSHQMAGQNHKQRKLGEDGTPDQEKKVGLAGPHPAKTNVQHGMPCSKWNPQGKQKRGRPRSTWRKSVETEGQTLGHSWGHLEVLSRARPSGGSLWLTYAPHGAQGYKFVVDLGSTWSTSKSSDVIRSLKCTKENGHLLTSQCVLYARSLQRITAGRFPVSAYAVSRPDDTASRLRDEAFLQKSPQKGQSSIICSFTACQFVISCPRLHR